jgi:hypothetical protein
MFLTELQSKIMNIFDQEKVDMFIQMSLMKVTIKKRKREDGDTSTRPKKILIVD